MRSRAKGLEAEFGRKIAPSDGSSASGTPIALLVSVVVMVVVMPVVMASSLRGRCSCDQNCECNHGENNSKQLHSETSGQSGVGDSCADSPRRALRRADGYFLARFTAFEGFRNEDAIAFGCFFLWLRGESRSNQSQCEVRACAWSQARVASRSCGDRAGAARFNISRYHSISIDESG